MYIYLLGLVQINARAISEIQPRKVFPVHTENAALFRKVSNGVQVVTVGREYGIR
jgi:hypothetical protein